MMTDANRTDSDDSTPFVAYKWEGKWKGAMGSARAYVFDADTGEELASFAWFGRSESGIWNGKRWTDTCLGMDVVDVKTREKKHIDASSFAGRRVAVKTWYSADKVEWTALVNRAKGWQGNEADKGGLPRVELGITARMWKLTRDA
jgi:hypothetical protein